MPTGKLVYIGNKAFTPTQTPTQIDVLSALLEAEGFEVISASSKRNKIRRMLHMIRSVQVHAKSANAVLIDTYSTQNFYYAVIIARLCNIFKTSYIPILHGGNLPSRLKRSPTLSRQLFQNARVNVAPSNYLMDAFKKEGYTNVIHIPNTIAIDQYPFLIRHKPRLKLLWVRSFSNIYNPQLALSIVEKLQDLGHEVALTMVGPDRDGSLDICKHIASQKSLPVSLAGKLTKSEWIELATEYDIFINTTNFDNTPVSVMEAMALGLPVVSTNVGGLPYLIEHGKDGLLVPPNDPEAFIDALLKVVSDADLARELALQARKKVEKFDWQTVKGQWNALLSS